VEGFRDKKKTGLVSSVGIYSPKFGLGSFENPKMIGRGEVDAGIINPPVTAKLAMEGKGPYKEPVGELRAIARFPEPDYIFWLLACREDMPEELAYLLARVSTDQRDAIAAPYKDRPKHLQSFEIPITPQRLCTKCVIPLHRGAEKYYREIGAL